MSQGIYGHDLEALLSSRIAQADALHAEIAELRQGWALERHPFMQRWLAGRLRLPELQSFAAEHYHVVVALERVARRAAALSEGLLAERLGRYADDQDEALDSWFEFAVASGWGRSAWYFGEDPLPQTVACAGALTGDRSLVLHLVTIYALESALSELAPRQLEALTCRYRFDECSTRYFALRAERSADAALTAEAGLTGLLPIASPADLVGHAELAYRSYVDLLSGVELLAGAGA
ncbi:MAG TPA: hypothetical protein VGI67_09470 [Thermoleophilaceae bacterium]|jgi:pyrroloquinoline quinone (PQQ) biosynthesis protein C